MDKYAVQTGPVDSSGETTCQDKVPRFLSVAGLMTCTGLSRSSINRQIKAGNIPTVRIGSRVLIPCSFLETLLNIAEIAAKEAKDAKLQS